MKILIVNVCLRGGDARLLLPIGLGYIATAVADAGYQVDILDIDRFRLSDEQVEKELLSRKYDVVLMGCIINGYRHVKKIANIVKSINQNIKIIVGNTVASSIPHHLLTNTEVDIAVIGEGDTTIVEVLNCLAAKDDLRKVNGICFKRDGKIEETPARKGIANLDSLPIVNWELFDVKGYIEKGKDNVNEPCPIPFDGEGFYRSVPLVVALIRAPFAIMPSKTTSIATVPQRML